MKTKTQQHTPGRTVQELAAGLARVDYDGTERFLAYSPERAAALDLLEAAKAFTAWLDTPAGETSATRKMLEAAAILTRAAIAKAQPKGE